MFSSANLGRSHVSHRNSVRRNQHRPVFEELEGRQTPSTFPYELHVNPSTPGDQRDSASAAAADGRRVVVYTSVSPTGTYGDIFAQRFSASGVRLGSPILVSASYTFDYSPAVCMDDTGKFVVTWTAAYSTGNRNIQMSRFSDAGVRLASITTIAGTSVNEWDSSIACSSSGEFVVAYTRDTTPTNQDVIAKRYSAAGAFLGGIAVAASTGKESLPAVARSMGSDASFAVAYRSGFDIHMKRYSAGGVLAGTLIIANTAKTEAYPAIAMDNNANSAVAWQVHNGQDWDVKARRVSSSGVLGAVFDVDVSKASDNDRFDAMTPSISLHPTNGKVVIAYQDDYVNPHSVDPLLSRYLSKVAIKEFSALDAALSTAATAAYDDDEDPELQRLALMYPFVSLAGDGYYLVSYTRDPGKYTDSLEQDEGVFARLGRLY